MKKYLPTVVKILTMVFCALIFWSSTGIGKEVRITDFAVTNNRDDLLIFFNVKGAFTQDMVEAIQNGIPTTFSFFIQLAENRSLWFKKKIVEKQLTHTIKYNNLKNEYLITRSWDNNKTITTDAFKQAKSLMSEIKSLRITSLDRLKKNHSYRIQAKAELDKVTLPFNLHYILFFTALWDFETSWHTFEFDY